MPQINRVRIINFSYNNNKRHIVDEKFNFYQGENALLNLANGGGKSVLVQLLMQPIIPRVRLQGRNIADFFRKRKLPTYVLIEWKLDDKGGYLLTGICLSGYDLQSGDSEVDRAGIRYFTFTSRYTHPTALDIDHLPLVHKKDNMVNIMSFKEATDMLREESRKPMSDLSYFSEDEADEYGRHLATFNISQDEWRTIIAKINDDEGGVKEIFEKCKTSQQLMNDWLIKTVEKVIYRNKEDSRKLEQMLENLVDEMIANEQYIHDKQIMEEFLSHMREYTEAVEGLLNGLNEQRELENTLAGLYRFLMNEMERIKAKATENEESIKKCQQDLARIAIEEKSLEYHQCMENYNRLRETHLDVLKQNEEAKARLDAANHLRDVQKAAELYAQIRELDAELARLAEMMNAEKSKAGRDERIKCLEYSLKLAYETRLAELDGQLQHFSAALVNLQATIERCDQAREQLADKMLRLQEECGALREKKARFEKEEKTIKQRLGLTYGRNLLGEVEPQELKTATEILNEKLNQARKAKEHLELEINRFTSKMEEAENKLRRQSMELVDWQNKAAEMERLLAEYDGFEHRLQEVFVRHGLDFAWRFNHEYCQKYLGDIIAQLEGKVYETKRELDRTAETINSLKKGTLHVSADFADFLAAVDIEYDTGETYLRKQKKEIRDKLMAQNPLLPFSFILSTGDLNRLAGMDLKFPIRQPVPLLTFENLDKQLAVRGRLVNESSGMAFMCLYDGRMLDVDDLTAYIQQLEGELQEGEERLAHFRQALAQARADNALVVNFCFAKDYRYKLTAEHQQAKEKVTALQADIEATEQEKKELDKRRKSAYQELQLKQAAINAAENDLHDWADFVERNEQYQLDRKRLDQCLKEIASAKERADQCTAEREDAGEKLRATERERDDAYRLQREIKAKYELVRHAEPAQVEKEDEQVLEARLTALKNEYAISLQSLEQEAKRKQEERNTKKRDLAKLKLNEQEYLDVRFDAGRLEQLEDEIDKLELAVKQLSKEESNAKAVSAKAEGIAEQALREVLRLGVDRPLPVEEIRMNFADRQEKCHSLIEAMERENKELQKRQTKYTQMAEKIGEQVDISAAVQPVEYLPAEDVVQEYEQLFQRLKNLKQNNVNLERQLNSQYTKLENNYREKNSNIMNIFKGLEPLKQKADQDFAGYYYFYERIEQQNEILNDLLKIYETRLANLERNKNDMVQQSYLHAVQVYEEIQKITEDSAIKLPGKARPVQMLKIEMLPLEEKHAGLEKMRSYIEYCINKVRDEIKRDKKREEIRKNIGKLMSSWELLNTISDLSKLSIKAFKIDLNINNSEYKTWEQVMRENSGGERFVSFFAVLAALMSYTRKSGMAASGLGDYQDTRVLIMDNPFGPISSEHLLKPLFEIAKKYKTQLICLTDLKQNSILNCFNLIYMLKIRTSTLGINEYVKFEEHIRGDVDLKENELLERSMFRASDLEQLSLFEGNL